MQRALARRLAARWRCCRSALVMWHLVVRVFAIPPYVLPGPRLVLATLIADWPAAVGIRCW